MSEAEQSPNREIEDEIAVAQQRVGQTVGGKWRLDRLLGIGGMASVYAATHKNNLKTVAVKVLHAELQRNESVRARFLREGYVANKVAHPGVVSAIDDGVDESGAVFIVMELLTGKSLAQRFDEQGGKLAPREVLEVVDGLLDVLAAAHAQGIVHRDLKPDNVFITEDGGVKVLDFGVARVLEGGAQTGDAKTKSGVVLGTPEYMPPEQARGRVEAIDGRTDIWATAAMMHRLITGQYVHEADTPNEVLLLAMTKPAKKLVERDPNIPPAVSAVVDRALAFEPADRYPDAEAMRAAVKEALAALGGDSAPAVDPGGKTLPIGDSDILVVNSTRTPSARSSPDESSPKQSLWVHTKATPPAAPKAPKKQRAWLPIVGASGALALLCVGIAWGVPRMHSARPVAAASASASGSSVAADPPPSSAPLAATDSDAAADEEEVDDEESDAAPASTAAVKPHGTAVHTAVHHTTHTKTKKKHH